MIKAEKLTFGFSSTPLFQNISFSLEENCHCALIGSNGTGKTTLIRKIAEALQKRQDIKTCYMHQNYEELLDL